MYIGRGTRYMSASKWGNPYVIDIHGSRTEVVNLFEEYFMANEELRDSVSELYGKN